MKAAFVASLVTLMSLVSASAAFSQAPGANHRLAPKEIQRDPLTEIPSNLTPLCYPNSKFVTGTLTRYARTKTTRIVRVSAPGSVTTVKDWYERALPGLGYRASTGNTITGPHQHASIYATKSDGGTCAVDLSGEGTSIASCVVLLTVNDAR